MRRRNDQYCSVFHWLGSDWAHRFRQPVNHDGQLTTSEIIGTVGESVGVGQPLTIIGELPPAYRQLFQDTDFHFIAGKVFKKRDPISDAKDGDAGRDIIDLDKDELEQLEEKYRDRPDVIAFLQENPDVFLKPIKASDAMNFAQNGLQDVPGEGKALGELPELRSSIFELIDTEGLNSQMTAAGYMAPRDNYQFCAGNERQLWGEAKARRDRLFGDLLADAKDLEDERQIKDFLDSIREDYYNDKKIRQCWSRKEFDIDRALYMDSLRRQGLDEETIRRKLWAGFDRVQTRVPAIIENGKVLRAPKKIQPSVWMKGRMEAMQEITLTYDQWSKIYDIVKQRREYCSTEGSRQTAIALMNYVNKTKDLQAAAGIIRRKQQYLNSSNRTQVWKVYYLRQRNLQRRASNGL